MNLDLSSDQELFRATCQRFLTDTDTLGQARRSAEQAEGFDPSWWRVGADIGLAAMFVPEEYGGGSISGSPICDAVIAAEELGRTAAPGPFHPVNIVAYALARSASVELQRQYLPALCKGDLIASWAFGEPRSQWDPGQFLVEGRVHDGALVVNGTKSYVEAADAADVFLVPVTSPDGMSQVLVPSASDGVRVVPQQTLDLGRRFGTVHFDNVRVELANIVGGLGAGLGDIERQLQLSLVLQVADSVGAIGVCFERTCEYAQDRVAFGRPIASFQAVKHKLADMLLWVESCRAISDGATTAVDDQTDDVAELLHTAKVFVGYRAVDIVQESIQVHGGIGLTWEHDLHLFLRRVGLNRMLYGTPEEHELRLGELLRGRRTNAVH